MADNAWNLAEIGFGVTGLLVAGLAVGRYVAMLAQFAPPSIHADHDRTTDGDGGGGYYLLRLIPRVFSVRIQTPPTLHHACLDDRS